MIRTTITLAAALALAPAASAGPDTDYPHRDWGQVATLDMKMPDATACVAREVDRKGAALVLPVDGGNDIDFSVGAAFGNVGEPWIRFQLRQAGHDVQLRAAYRHPAHVKLVSKYIRGFQKRCLKVRSITPATE